MNAPYRAAGTIGRPHKLSGAFYFYTHLPLSGDSFPETLFIRDKNTWLPVFVKQVNATGDQCFLLELEDYPTREAIVAHQGKELFLPEDQLDEYFEAETTGWEFLMGYEVFDGTASIGKVDGLEDNGFQYLARVISDSGKTILIPLVEEWITETREAEKQIHFDLPEGLTEL